MKMIAAVADNLAIGKDNKLLYHLPADMGHFKRVTTGGVVLMGRKTFESLPNGPLPLRENVVLSKTMPPGDGYGIMTRPDLFAIFQTPCYVIGGESLYKLYLPFVQELIITHVHDTPKDADAFFPEFREWFKPISSRHIPKDDKNTFNMDIVHYIVEDNALYQPLLELFRDFLVQKNLRKPFQEYFNNRHRWKLEFNRKGLIGSDVINKNLFGNLRGHNLFDKTLFVLESSETAYWNEMKEGHEFWYQVFNEFRQFSKDKLLGIQ